MQRSYVNLTHDLSRGMGALSKSNTPAVYSDAVRVEIAGCSLLYISGKTGVDDSHQLVGRTMLEQTEQVLKNISKVIEREGGTMDDVVRVRVYVTQLDSKSLHDIHAVRARFFTEGRYPASTLVRVDQLVRDGGLIEIEADAVLSKRP
ncbi:RidA family protein [Pseudolabrys sp.]|uniref:RidA family protein n=1 Tax=Pseudolabrys sp. TaxID=1960880 RepID=UPI003D0F874D